MNKTKIPNLFFAGFPKCGTTVLYEYLKNHESITASLVKEPHYFLKIDNRTSKYSKEEYITLFEKENIYLADFSPRYIWNKKSLENIYSFNPNSKIILIIRNPIDVIPSRHNQNCKRNIEDRSLEEAIGLQEDRKKGRFLPKNIKNESYMLFYWEWVFHFNKIKNLLDIFPKNQIKIILYEEFEKDNQKIVTQICNFLNISDLKIKRKSVNIRQKINYVKFRRFVKNLKILNIIPNKLRKKLGLIFDKLTMKPNYEKKVSIGIQNKIIQNTYKDVLKFNRLLHKENLIDKNINLIKYWGYKK